MIRVKILELTFKFCLATILIAIVIAPLKAQDPESVLFLKFQYGLHIPSADLKERFGTNSDFGASFEIAGLHSKFFAGAEGLYIFGNVVKEDVLAGLRAFDGSIIGINGGPADVNLKERGYYLGIYTGKVIPFSKKEKNLTGLRLHLGAGFLQHKIRVQDNTNAVVALERNKLKGYDRLTNGPAAHFAAGFQYHSARNNFHFHIMGDVYGARTQSRRDFDNATGGFLAEKRTDILAGLNVAYIVLISRQKSADQIYY